MSCVYRTMFDVPHESAADKTQSGGSTIFWVPQSLTDLAPEGVTTIYPQMLLSLETIWLFSLPKLWNLQICSRRFSCLYNAEGMNESDFMGAYLEQCPCCLGWTSLCRCLGRRMCWLNIKDQLDSSGFTWSKSLLLFRPSPLFLPLQLTLRVFPHLSRWQRHQWH